MTLFEGVRVISFEPPAVSEPMDVAVAGPEEDFAGSAFGSASGAAEGPAGGTVLETGTGLAAKYPGAKRVAGAYLTPGSSAPIRTSTRPSPAASWSTSPPRRTSPSS